MEKFREIIRLHELGRNQTEIARSCKVARSTVQDYLRRAAAKSLDYYCATVEIGGWRQLELKLEVAFEEASEIPETTDVLSLWARFESDLAGLEQRGHLRVAGDILLKLAGLCETKSDVLWEDWQDAHNAEGPVMDGDWLQGLTRQTQELDFSDLVQRSYQTGDRLNEDKADKDSVAGDVAKLSVLDMIDALEDADLKSQALAVSHAENVSDWVKALAEQQAESPQRLVDIQQQLQMPLIEVWIAALLGGFSMEQRGSFYQTQEVWVIRCQ